MAHCLFAINQSVSVVKQKKCDIRKVCLRLQSNFEIITFKKKIKDGVKIRTKTYVNSNELNLTNGNHRVTINCRICHQLCMSDVAVNSSKSIYNIDGPFDRCQNCNANVQIVAIPLKGSLFNLIAYLHRIASKSIA